MGMNGHRFQRQGSAVVVAFAILFTLLVSPLAEASSASSQQQTSWTWPDGSGIVVPFRPADQLVTTQNPPDFSWPYIRDADKYELQVSEHESFAIVNYEQELSVNYYNFPFTFRNGTWHWRVRYEKDGVYSVWTEPRQFRITQDAVPFPVLPVDQLRQLVPTGHPRVWATADTLEAFRSLADGTGAAVYENKLANANTYMNLPLPPEPTAATRNDGTRDANRMLDTAFIYLITGEEAYGQSARAQLLNIASWDPYGATGYSSTDQVHRVISFRSAMVYDWIYDILSPADKTTILNMLKVRGNIMFADLVEGGTPIVDFPYNAHGWTSYGFLGVMAVALLHDLPEAQAWFDAVVPSYINLLPTWGGEEGGWAQGTGYWRVSSIFNKDFMDVLLSATGFNLYEKAYSRNEGRFPLYMFPHGSPRGTFGDDSEAKPGGYNVSLLNRLADMQDDPVLQWGARAVGTPPLGDMYDYFFGSDDLEAVPPITWPKAAKFDDTGWVSMHSELYDPERISLYFKSSPYGSFNHSHADQNSFIIDAYGESLAVDSGYYDEYNTFHHGGFTRQTLAHNAITFDGKQGQPVHDIDADGRITGFVTHPAFDATSGDATAAYKGTLEKAKRHIVYVRPDHFVVIDQLETNDSNGTQFEFNFHADDRLTLDPDGKGALATKGKAGLKLRFHSPGELTATVTDRFLNHAGVEVRPGGRFAAKPDQQHAMFATEEITATTLVSSLQPYRLDSPAPTVQSSVHGNYVQLDFEEGTTVYVRLTETGIVDAGDVEFDGVAASVRDDGSVLLVEGTSLHHEGIELIASDKPVTVAYDASDLSISVAEAATVELYAPDSVSLRNTDGSALPNRNRNKALNQYGVYWKQNDNKLKVTIENGDHQFKLSTDQLSRPLPDRSLEVVVNGVSRNIELKSAKDLYGRTVSWGMIDVDAGFYRLVEAPDTLIFESFGRPELVYLQEGAAIMLLGESVGALELETESFGAPLETVVYENYDLLRDHTAVWKEAETFTATSGGDTSIYTTRPFLSGGAGMGNWLMPGQRIRWKLEVPQNGVYDLVLKYVAGYDLKPGEKTSRYAEIDGERYYFEAEPTADYGTTPESWRGLRVRLNKELTAGPIELELTHTFGQMNLDWIGLAPSSSDVIPPSTPGNVLVESAENEEATISWDSASDNVAVSHYVIMLDGTAHGQVTADTGVYTITGLDPGRRYAVAIYAVDTSGNRSAATNIEIVTEDTAPPVWGAGAVLETDLLLPTMARLNWSGAEDGDMASLSYHVYQHTGSAGKQLIATVSNSVYDVMNLTPSASYTFSVEAMDGSGNISTGGPSLNFDTPATNPYNGIFDFYDDWPTGPFSGGAYGYTVATGTGAEVTVENVEQSYVGNRALRLYDGRYNPANEYEALPQIVSSGRATLSGIVTMETKFKFLQANHASGNYNIDFLSGTQAAAKFTGLSNGGFAYWDTVNGGTVFRAIPSSGTLFKLPVDEWVTVRMDVDTTAHTYDLTVQAESLKNYEGAVDAPGILDRQQGVYQVKDIPFLDNNSFASVNGFRMNATRYTGTYLFDYVFMYEQP
jgi:chitodextrinase